MSNYEIEKVDGITIIQITGEMVSSNIEGFENACEIALKDDPEIIALDTEFTEQIDSISINHLFQLGKKLIEKESDFFALQISPRISELLEVIRFDSIVKIMTKEQFEKDYIRTS